MKTACVILAAGEGTRMRTKVPKVLHPICAEPMIFYPVTLALNRGWDPIVVVISSQGEAVRTYLSGRFGDRIRFAVQDPPLGTGDAVMSAHSALKGFKGKLAILYGDVPLLTAADLNALERASKGTAVAFITCRLDDPSWYGRVIRDDRGQVLRIVEQKDASKIERQVNEINAGIYLVDAPFVCGRRHRGTRSDRPGRSGSPRPEKGHRGIAKRPYRLFGSKRSRRTGPSRSPDEPAAD